jgi:signal transduction histidine kinase
VLAGGRHLLALMDDILDLSSLQTGNLALRTETVDLGPVVTEAWTMLATAAQAQAVVLINEIPAGEACTMQADRRRLKQIVINLLSNAIKYNRPGGTVRLWVLRQAQTLELNVADSGCGMDQEQQGRLFHPFDRLGAERGPVTGTGLGLALSRQLAEAMGGSLSATSRLDEGSTFSLRLPAA